MTGKNGKNGHLPGFVLTAVTSISSPDLAKFLGVGNPIKPGTELPPSCWHMIRNLASMESAGTVAWRPPATFKPALKATPVRSTPIRLDDFEKELAIRLSLIMDKRQCSQGEAEDWLLDTEKGWELLKRAQVQYSYRHRHSIKGFRQRIGELMGGK